MNNIILSKVEQIKTESDYLAGRIGSQLQNSNSYFEENEIQLLKFHGTYQQYNRDTATELKKKGLEKEFSFMIRTKIPAGILTSKQYIELDDLTNKHKINWFWVKGHAGHEFNERADMLANKGLDDMLENS